MFRQLCVFVQAMINLAPAVTCTQRRHDVYTYIIFGKGENSFNNIDMYNKFKHDILLQNQHKTSNKIAQRDL